MEHDKKDRERKDHEHKTEHMDHERMDHNKMDHNKMDHDKMNQEHKDHKQETTEHTSHGGMDHERMDHGGHHASMVKDFQKRFIVSIILTVPVLILSPMMQEFLGFSFTFQGAGYVLFAVSSAIFLYGGYPFFKGFYDEMRKRAPGMMTLIAVAITVAYVYSTAVTFGLEGMVLLLGARHSHRHNASRSLVRDELYYGRLQGSGRAVKADA